MLTKMKNKSQNIWKLKILKKTKKKKWSGDMVERELPTKFGLDLRNQSWRTTDAGRLRHDSSSADKVKQS